MQFNDQTPLAPIALDSYTAGEIIINQTAYTHNVQLGDNVALFAHASPHDLTLADFQAALNAGAEIILIGTGAKQQFLSPKLAAALSAHSAALECMTTAAACRTYALLASEGRKVWAWLWV